MVEGLDLKTRIYLTKETIESVEYDELDDWEKLTIDLGLLILERHIETKDLEFNEAELVTISRCLDIENEYRDE